MIKFIKEYLSALYCGLGFGKFTGRKYNDAIKYLEKAYKLAPEGDRMEILFSTLGQSYLAVGKNDEALEKLSIAYDHYKNPECPPKADGKDDYNKFIYELLVAYNEVLKRFEKHELASKIKLESDTLISGI